MTFSQLLLVTDDSFK